MQRAEYFLSPESAFRLIPADNGAQRRWWPIPHSGLQRSAYVLHACETLQLGTRHALGHDCVLHVRYAAAHETPDPPGATLTLDLTDGQSRTHSIASLSVHRGAAGLVPTQASIDLSPWADQTVTLALRASADQKAAIALFEAVIAPVDRLELVRARAFHEERARNELAHFEHVYAHAVYAATAPADHAERNLVCKPLEAWVASAPAQVEASLEPVFPVPSELPYANGDAFHYAHALLTRELKAVPPDFASRLAAMQRGRPLRILSLCSGAARIEAGFAAAPGLEAEWTLMDLNEGLLQDAAASFPRNASLQLVVGNLNQVQFFGQRFDVILCVSGLHHIVELERVVEFIRTALEPDGEFWSIGEAIGRNGNRLWPEDYAVANAHFRSLPERLRLNRNTGSVDANLPATDYSNASFEGIRSEDIEELLCRRLVPVHVYRRNCFLWRIVDLAYADNYDLARAEDVAWLQRAVAAELRHFRAGGRAAELHAVFRRQAD